MIRIDLNQDSIDIKEIEASLFNTNLERQVMLPPEDKINTGHMKLEQAIADKKTIYGVTTGFGDCSRRVIAPEHASKLQENLISYLTCGVGPTLPLPVCRAVVLYRLQSLSRGLSAISYDLLKTMKWTVMLLAILMRFR